jgi:shikimate dehydrogenase
MFGLIGTPLTHSFSQWIHEKLTNVEYHVWDVEDLDAFFQSTLFQGINVTHPYKEAVIPYCDRLDSVATRCHSVNTIVIEEGKRVGYNTDYEGLQYLISTAGLSLSGKHVVILGTGGAAKTAQVLAMDLGAHVTMLSRRSKEGTRPIKEFASLESIDLLIHATPVGTTPNESVKPLVDLSTHKEIEAVIDLVYNPRRTNLMIEAELQGIPAYSGLLMLLTQALKAAERFHQTTYSMDWVLQTLIQQVKSTTNLVFIGMPMSGKSFIARQLADYMNKAFVDIDALIEEQAEMSIPTLFATQGEAVFRTLEQQMIDLVAKEKGMIIATGGGAILNEANVRALKRHGVLIFLDMPLSTLLTADRTHRPLLKDDQSLVAMYELRYPRYMHYADIILQRTGYDEQSVIYTLKEALDAYYTDPWTKS